MSNLSDRDKKVVWHPFTQMKTAKTPVVIVKAKDTLLFDEDGKQYIDINSSWWVNVHGHGREEIKEAMSAQFEQIDHVIFAGATHPKAIELAERIVEKLPENFKKVFFSDNGSTAVEVALKMVIQFWYNQGKEKKKFVALEGAYHGDTFGAMSIGQRGYFNQPFESYFFDVDYLRFPTEESEDEILKDAEQFFKNDDVAGLIVEPLVQGSAGMRIYSARFLDKLVKLAKKHGVLVIFDEVMTGFGRTGKFFAMDHCQEKPDIACLSKGLTAGVIPLGLTVATQEIFDAFYADEPTKALLHGHSFTGNAIACAVACASLDVFEQKVTFEHIDRISKQQLAFKSDLEETFPFVDVQVLGTILSVVVNTPGETSYFNSIKLDAVSFFKERGIWLRPLGNVLFFNPPYCITESELKHCYETLKEFLSSVK